MSVNIQQEKHQIAKDRKDLKVLHKEQSVLEKHMAQVKVNNPGEKEKVIFRYICPKCKGTNTTAAMYCKDCKKSFSIKAVRDIIKNKKIRNSKKKRKRK